MSSKRDHSSYMGFISKLSGLLSEISYEDLVKYERMARRGFPHLVPVIRACIRMVPRDLRGRAEIGDREAKSIPPSTPEHLFDLLRSKQIFPSNTELADFASRVLPGMTRRRFDKMSRADIASRIIEYLESTGGRKRERLEEAMRDAVNPKTAPKIRDRESFFSQWEGIIKGIEL